MPFKKHKRVCMTPGRSLEEVSTSTLIRKSFRAECTRKLHASVKKVHIVRRWGAVILKLSQLPGVAK